MTFKYVVIALITIVALVLYLDPMGKFDPEQTISRSDTTIVNLPDIQVTLPAGKPSIVTVTIPQTVDTSKIIQEYFTTLKYEDYLETDSVKVHLTEWVRENRIIDRKLKTSFKFTTSNITNYVEEKRNKVYLGGSVDFTTRPTLAVHGMIVNKRDLALTGSYNPFTRTWTGGVLVKVKIKR